MTAFDEAWDFLKADPIDMHEYPPGSGRFMSLQDMIMARNADAKRNIQANPPQPKPTSTGLFDNMNENTLYDYLNTIHTMELLLNPDSEKQEPPKPTSQPRYSGWM